VTLLRDLILLVLYVGFCWACYGLVQAIRAELNGDHKLPTKNWP
jgi:hypothetical protein